MYSNNCILIADDDPKLRKTLTDILSVNGYSPLPVKSGKKAIKLAESEKPPVALVDLKLGDMSGMEVIKGIKQASPHTESIVLTGFGSRTSAVEAMNVGAYNYIEKPYDVDRLFVTIQGALEKHLAAVELQRLKDFHEGIVHAISEGIAVVDAEGCFTYVNPTTANLLGYSIEELFGRDSKDVVPLDYHEVIDQARKRRSRGETDRYELELLHKDGRRIPVQISGVPRFENGRFAGTLAVYTNLTHFKQSQQDLLESEQRFRSTFEQTAVGIAHLTPEGRYIRINQPFCEMMGYTEEELLALTFQEISHPDDLETDLEKSRQLLAGEIESFSMEKRYICKDGSIRWGNLTASHVRDESGDTIYAIAVVEDITKRKEAEAALQENERQFRSTFEQTAVGIAHLNPEGRYIRINQTFCEMMGYTEDELLALTFQEITHPDDLGPDVEKSRQLLEGEINSYSREKRYVRKDGSIMWANLATSIVWDESGDFIIGVSVIEDITKRKMVEDALKSSEELFRTSIENMLDCFGIYTSVRDQEGNILDFRVEYVNEAACQNNLMTKEEQIGKHLCEILPAHRETGLFFEYCEVVETGKPLIKESLFYDEVYGEDRIKRAFNIHAAKLGDGFIAAWRDITERKKAEEHIAYQSRLLENVNDAIVAVDDRFTVMAWNRAAEEIHGWKAEEAIGRVALDLIPSELTDAQRKEVLRTLDEEGHYRTEISTIRKDGQRIYVEGTTVPLRNEGGQITGYLSVNRDITERKLAEMKLLESEEQLLSVFGTMAEGLVLISPEGVILRANPVGERILGLKNSEIEGKLHIDPDWELYRTDGTRMPAEEFPSYQVLVENRPVRDFEMQFKRPDDAMVWLNVNADPIMDGGGEVESVVLTFADTTERKAAEEELWKSEERYRQVVTTSTDAIVIYDADTKKILDINKACEALYGYSRDEFLNLKQEDITAEPGASEASIRKTLDGTLDKIALRYHKKKDGTEFPVEISASTFMLGGRRVLCGVVRDITERKRAEDKLQAANTSLKDALAELNATQAKVVSQERLTAVGELAAGIAHDFNNILVPITLYSELMLGEESLSETGTERLNTILTLGRRAASLTDQILDFSRRGVIQLQALDLEELLQDFMKLLHRVLPENIYINFPSGSGKFIVNADVGRMQQVFMNLILNSRDALPDGGNINVGFSHLEFSPADEPPFLGMAPGTWVELEVSDTGEGIDPEHLPHIFEPFFTTKEGGKGTGLGLAQVYGIVKQHGGFIDVKSEVGKGSTFFIWLPAMDEIAEQLPEVKDKDVVEGSFETILVVEDNLAVQAVLCELLKSLGYQVLASTNGEEAIEIFEREQVDLVISDLVMPKLGGIALYNQLRERVPEIKMMMITGYPLEEREKKLLEEGYITWIQKPLDSEMLSRSIREVFSQGNENNKT